MGVRPPDDDAEAFRAWQAGEREAVIGRAAAGEARLLGRIAVVAHELVVGPDGTILPAGEDVVMRLRPTPP